MKPFSITNYIILFGVLIVLLVLYRRFEDKRIRQENNDDYKIIQEYLLNDQDLDDNEKRKKPILWIHVPYEYNSRKWLSFGSRSSYDLNQPYLYLTVRSIITQCDNSFTICMIDDNAFKRLIPGWNVDMSKITDPILNNMRQFGLMKLLYIYGGIICPVSFLCMKDLIGLYNKGINGDKMFLCESNDKNVTSSSFAFYPSINFSGASKNNMMVQQLIDFMQRIISTDYTAESVFLGDFDRWCESRIRTGQMNLINGFDIGIRTVEDEPIKVEDLMSQQYLKLYPGSYGILIPANEILNRKQYEWFSRLSHKQVLESNTIIGNYLLLATTPNAKQGILEPLKEKTQWVGFWKTPLVNGLYGLKPNFLGDNVVKQKYTGR
jgi:hypothetical protein